MARNREYYEEPKKRCPMCIRNEPIVRNCEQGEKGEKGERGHRGKDGKDGKDCNCDSKALIVSECFMLNVGSTGDYSESTLLLGPLTVTSKWIQTTDLSGNFVATVAVSLDITANDYYQIIVEVVTDNGYIVTCDGQLVNKGFGNEYKNFIAIPYINTNNLLIENGYPIPTTIDHVNIYVLKCGKNPAPIPTCEIIEVPTIRID